MSDASDQPRKHKKAKHKNKPIAIPLSFEQAVKGLMKVKPKKDQGKKETS